MTSFVTGINGQLGHDVVKELMKRGHIAVGSGSSSSYTGADDMRFFVTGVNGQLGHDVMNELAKRDHDGVGSDIATAYAGLADGSAVTTMAYVGLDITDKMAVQKTVKEINPDVVIHCAAWTAVDMAEDDDKVKVVRRVNARGTQNIADVCQELDCKMVYLSTDYVFDGQGTEP